MRPRLRERIGATHFDVVPEQISITASFGVCALEHHFPVSLHGLARQMLRDADAALYRSKHSGRDRVTACNISSSDAPHANLV